MRIGERIDNTGLNGATPDSAEALLPTIVAFIEMIAKIDPGVSVSPGHRHLEKRVVSGGRREGSIHAPTYCPFSIV